MVNLNNSSSSVIPYFLDKNNQLYLIMEQKDSKYFRPFFNNGFNFIGGNWIKGINSEHNTLETLFREIDEEFFQRDIDETLLKQLLIHKTNIIGQFNENAIVDLNNDLKQFSDILKSDVKLFAIYNVKVNSLIKNLNYLSSIYSKSLNQDEFDELAFIIKKYAGIMTADNIKHKSRIVNIRYNELNESKAKFSWGYDHIINQLLLENQLPKQKEYLLGLCDLIQVQKIQFNGVNLNQNSISYKNLENLGYVFN